MVITDGVFSMDGDIAKLPEIVEIAEEFDLITYVDGRTWFRSFRKWSRNC